MNSATGRISGEREAGLTVRVGSGMGCVVMEDRSSSLELKSSWENVTGVGARSCSAAGEEALEPLKTLILLPVI